MNNQILINSIIGRDFLRLKNRNEPNIDEMLDYRNQLNKLREINLNNYPDEWYQNEVNAADEIIKYLSDN